MGRYPWNDGVGEDDRVRGKKGGRKRGKGKTIDGRVAQMVRAHDR